MKIITTIKEITEALPGLLAVTPKRPTHAVLANIYCQTIKENGKEGIRLRATNLQSYLTVFIACNVVESGECCIPAKLFSDIITKTKSSGVLELILSGNGEELTIGTNNLKQAIKAYDSSEFIEFPKPQETDKQVTVDGIQFFNTFTVDNLPGGFGDVFFAVGEIEHSVSDGNWDTTIVGYMMINT